MCGIAGIISREKIIPGSVEGIILKMKHRGPDDEGFYYDKNIAIGQSRLSIIDLSGGHQPMVSEDGNIVLVFNGEIYNYKELTKDLKRQRCKFFTKSDSEVLIHLYQKYGEKMLSYLNGMFAFAIYDKKNNKIFIARDRVGVKPLYIYQRQGFFAFASEIEGLRALSEVRCNLTLNKNALWHYFSLLYVPPPITIYNEIEHLPAGHFLVYEKGRARVESYWQPKIGVDSNISLEQAMDELDQLLKSSVQLRMQSDVPYGAYLSGGIDSSLIVSKMAALSRDPIKTFTVQIQDALLDERVYAQQVSDFFKTDHRVLSLGSIDLLVLKDLCRFFGQPFADSSILPTFLISRKIREYVTVVLGGDGGDELFAGYDKYLLVYYDGSRESVKRAFVNRVSDSVKKQFFSTDFLREFEKNDTFDYLCSHPANSGYQGFDLLRFLDIQFFLQGDILPKLDSMSMASSLEAREPLLDYRIMELALRLPKHLLVNEKQNKVVLKTMLRKYFSKEFTDRQKVGFVIPIAQWLRGNIQTIREIKMPANVQNIFNPICVQNAIDNFEQGDTSFANILFAYLQLNIWTDQSKIFKAV